jgi:hypothetical protein
MTWARLALFCRLDGFGDQRDGGPGCCGTVVAVTDLPQHRVQRGSQARVARGERLDCAAGLAEALRGAHGLHEGPAH